MKKGYAQYVAEMQKIADVSYSIAVLQWDKEVQMPPKGARFRGQQIATLSGIKHDLATKDSFGELLDQLNDQKEELSPIEARNVELSRDNFLKNKKYSTEFVKNRSKVVSEAYHSWMEAKKANDYNLFKGSLGKIVDLSRKETQFLGYDGHPYDALIDHYEKGTTVATLDTLFTDVKAQLVAFVRELEKGTPVQNDFLKKHYSKDKQWDYGLKILKEIGYDFDGGRQDVSTHPFSINFSPEDVRVTTRIDENDFANMLWSTIHEGGHALYEQGLKTEQYGLPCGKYNSLGMHESQSRLWENNVGRGLGFWKSRYENLQNTFPENLSKVSLTNFYNGVNKVEPGFIRTESDELYYHFHVLIRYELEKELIEGTLEVENLNEVWNAKYKEYLGIDVPDDNRGILQDIHWSHGSFGYFPTYSLGSFYAAQFYQQAEKDLPNLASEIETGNTQSLLTWLRTNIHQHGRFYTAEDLCAKVTGEPLNFKYFMDYAKKKYSKIYNV